MKIKQSKPIAELKKGDKIKVNKKELEVDAHYVMIDHGNTKEMAIELFDPKIKKEGEGEYQIRYFGDNVEDTLSLYQLKEIMYESVDLDGLEW